MDSGRSHRQAIVCGLDYLAVDLLPLRRVAEAGVVEGDASSRSARGLHILPNPGSIYMYTQGGGLGVEEGVTGCRLMTQLSGHVTPVM